MAALNKKTVKPAPISNNASSVTSFSANGNIQFLKTAKLSLLEIASSVFYGKDQFYNSSLELYRRMQSNIRSLVAQDSFDYIANVVLFSRKQMDMRTYPIVLVVEFAKELRVQNKTYVNMRKLVRETISRADELTELYSYALTIFGDKKSIPLSIKKGVADAFNKFDEYQLSKYNGKNKSLALKDLIRIVHPVPKDTFQSNIFAKLMLDNLSTPYTWETELSANGQLNASEQKTKTQIWTELVDSGKIGYMALLKNLRNIESCMDQKLINKVVEIISNKDKVLRSKQFPMNFVTAYENVTNANIKTAISKAIHHSACNIPSMGKDICLLIDTSGSMGGKAITNAALFASMIIGAHQDSKVTTILFNNNATEVKGSSDWNEMIRLCKPTGGTNLQSAINLVGTKQFDAVFCLSDGDVNQTSLKSLKNLGGEKCIKVVFNFNASETTPFKDNNCFFITGLSSKVFSYLKYSKEADGLVDLLSTNFNMFPKAF